MIFASEKPYLIVRTINKFKTLTVIPNDLFIFSFVVKRKSFLYIKFKSFYSRYSIVKLRWPVALQTEYQQIDSQNLRNFTFPLLPIITSLRMYVSYTP